VKTLFSLALLAAGLAACGGTAQEYRNDKEQPRQGAFGDAFTWEWRKQNPPAPASSAPMAKPPAAPAQAGAKPSAPRDANRERQEFEEWRAWQEEKRKNAK
jgi:hypothetical protein